MTSPLRRNVYCMLASRLATHGLAILFNVLLARRLGSTGFGEYASLATMLFIANALTTFGTDMLLIREIAVSGISSRLRAALLLQLALSAASIALLWLLGSNIPGLTAEGGQALRIYSLALIPLAFFTVFTTALRGAERMDAYMLLNLALSAGQLAVFLLPHVRLAALALVLLFIQTGGTLLATFLCSVSIPKFWSRLQTGPVSISSLLRDAAPLAVLAVLAILYQRLVVLLLLVLAGPASSGIYSAAARVIEPVRLLQAAPFTALYPVMAREAALRAAPDHRLSGGYLRPLIAGALAAALSLVIFAPWLVRLLYGDQYAASAGILRVLAWSLIPLVANTYLILRLLAARREPAVAAGLAAALLCMLALSAWRIPIAGAQGAAWAVLGAESLQCALLVVLVRFNVVPGGQVCELPQPS